MGGLRGRRISLGVLRSMVKGGLLGGMAGGRIAGLIALLRERACEYYDAGVWIEDLD
jgi:predicted lipid-binding transport protein (Tim44 family)